MMPPTKDLQPSPTPCQPEVFKNGVPVMFVDTGSARTFETFIQSLAKVAGVPVDWHYSGGVAQVLTLGDAAEVQVAARTLIEEMGGEAAVDFRVMRWVIDGDALYRRGVTTGSTSYVVTGGVPDAS